MRACSLLSAFLPSSSFTQETVRAVALPGASAPPWGRRAPPGEKLGHSLRLPRSGQVWSGRENLEEGEGLSGLASMGPSEGFSCGMRNRWLFHVQIRVHLSFFKRAVTGQGAKCSKCNSALDPSLCETLAQPGSFRGRSRVGKQKSHFKTLGDWSGSEEILPHS